MIDKLFPSTEAQSAFISFLGGGGFDIQKKLIAMVSNLYNISKP